MTLGHVALLGAPEPPKPVPTTVWEVLAYMILQKRPVSRIEIAEVVFADITSQAATVRNTLSFIRKWVGDIIDTDGLMIAVRPECCVVCDVDVFLHGVREDAQISYVIFALANYHGRFLVRARHQWAIQMANHLEERYVAGLRRVVNSGHYQVIPYVMQYMEKLARVLPGDSIVQMQYLSMLAERQQHGKIAAHVQQMQQISHELSESVQQNASMSLLIASGSDVRKQQAMMYYQYMSEVWLPSRIFFMYQIKGVIGRFEAGYELCLNIIGDRYMGKTHLIQFMAHFTTTVASCYVPMRGRHLVYHLHRLFDAESALRDSAMLAVTQLPLAQQEMLAELLHTELTDKDEIRSEHIELLVYFLRFIGQRQRLLLLIDDASASIIELLMPMIREGLVGLICTSTEALCDDALAIPPMQRHDVAVLADFMLSEEPYPEALVDDLHATLQTPEDVMDTLVLRLFQQYLVWDDAQQQWQYYLPPAHGDLRVWDQLTDWQRETVSLIVMCRPLVVSKMPEWQGVDWAEHMPVLAQMGIGYTAEGTALTCWSLPVQQGVKSLLNDDQRRMIYRKLLPVAASALDTVYYLCVVGDYMPAAQLLAREVDVAWQRGRTMDLHAIYRLYEKLPVLSQQVQFEKDLTFVRLMRVDRDTPASRQHIQQIIQSIHPIHPLYFEMLMSAASVMRWNISVVEAMQLYERIFWEAKQAQRVDIQMRVLVQEWFFVGVETGQFGDMIAKIQHIQMPIFMPKMYALMQQIAVYVYANAGELTQAHAHWRNVHVQVPETEHSHDASYLLYNEAMLYFLTLQHDKSRQLMYDVYQVFGALNDVPYQSFAGLFLAAEYARHGMPETYEQLLFHIYQQSVTTILTRQRIVSSLLLSLIALRRKHWSFATVLVSEAYTLAETIGLVTYKTMASAIWLRLLRASQRSTEYPQARQRLWEAMESPQDSYRVAWYHDLAWCAYESQEYATALEYAYKALENAKRHTFSFELPIEVMASAAMVIQRCDIQAFVLIRTRVVDQIIAYVRTLSDPITRMSLIFYSKHLREFVDVPGSNGDRIVWLPRSDAPRGRTPDPEEHVPVIWDGAIVLHPTMSIAEKVQCLWLATESQHAVLLTSTLAQVLDVHVRTVLRALRSLESEGIQVNTYRSWKREKSV